MKNWMRGRKLMAGLLCAGLALASTQAHAQAQMATAQQVRELMNVMHVQREMKSVVHLMTANLSRMLSAQMACVPPSYWGQVFNKSTQEKMMARIIPIYQKNFTKTQMAQLIAFYKTPLGQHVIAVLPKIQHESFMIGDQIGRERMKELLGALIQKGVINSQGQCLSTESPHG